MSTRRDQSVLASLNDEFERIAAFCASRGIVRDTFRWWRWQLRCKLAPTVVVAAAAVPKTAKPVAIVPVAVTPSRRASSDAAVVIAVGDIEVPR